MKAFRSPNSQLLRFFASSPPPLPLSSIVHVEKMLEESPSTIKKTWLRHHMKKDLISSVLETASFEKLVERTTQCPHFVFPIPTPDKKGFRSVYFQASRNVHLYTDLEEFKLRQANATPLLSCVFFEELREKKGVVLMRGTLRDPLTPTEAALLANQTTMWYFDEDRFEHVRRFNHEQDKFDFDKVLDLMNRL